MAPWIGETLSSAAVVSVLLAIAGYLSRTWIAGRLSASLKVETESKLARLKTQLEAAEARITAVHSAGIQTNLQLSAVVLAERVAAIKAIWKGVVDWRAATAINMILHAMTLDYVRRHGNSPRTAQAVRELMEAAKHKELVDATNKLHYVRPFVTDRAWAMFAAYHVFYVLRMGRATALMLRQHEMAIRLWETNGELNLVRESAPQLLTEYEANPIATTPKFLGFIESELLAELQKSLAGEHSGPDAARQAAAIVTVTQRALNDIEPAPVPPDS